MPQSSFNEWTLPEFGPEWDKELTLESSAYKNKFYKFNLHRRTCSCRKNEDWNPVCRHQARYISEHESEFDLSSLERAIFSDYYGSRYYLRGSLRDGSQCILGCSCGSEWVNVYLSNGKRHAYSVDDDRWARGSEPPNRDAVVAAIEKHVVPFIRSKEIDDTDHVEVDITDDVIKALEDQKHKPTTAAAKKPFTTEKEWKIIIGGTTLGVIIFALLSRC